MQSRRYKKGCNKDEMQEDRIVGAEDLSTSSTGGLGGQSSSTHSMKQ